MEYSIYVLLRFTIIDNIYIYYHVILCHKFA